MIIKKAHSLSTRIVLSVALVFFLLFFAIFLVFDKINKDALYTAEKDKAEIIAEMIAPTLAVELYLGRDENVLAMADQITSNPNILSFELVKDGQHVVRRKNAQIGSSNTDENFNVEKELMHPVTKQPIAKLYLSYSSAHYHHLAGQYILSQTVAGKPLPLQRLQQQEQFLNSAYQHFSSAAQQDITPSYAAEWLLLNPYPAKCEIRSKSSLPSA